MEKYQIQKRKYKLNSKHKQDFKKIQYFFNVSQKTIGSPIMWNHQWNNLDLHYRSLLISQLLNRFLIHDGLYLNKLYIRIQTYGINILTNSLGIYRSYKAKKRIKLYKKKLKKKKPLSNLGKIFLNINQVRYIKIKFYNIYLPKKLIKKDVLKVFGKYKYKKERFFWESIQLVYGVFKGYVSANLLGNLIYMHTCKNPRRLGFITYIKRVLDWHFQSFSISQIQGLRLEIKGRFHRKSRSKKHILSLGRVKRHEKSSNVDYTRIDAITKFGSLGIKIWICPIQQI